MAATPILLGINSFLQYRSAGQQSDVLEAAHVAFAKGGDLVVREDLIWALVQPTEGGAYDWSDYDDFLTTITDAGWRGWWVLNKAPSWATAPGGDANDGYGCAPYPELVTEDSNNALEAYADFCAAAAARYGPGGTFWSTYVGTPRPVTHMEVWNEEYSGLNKLWNGTAAVDEESHPDKYADIYNAAYTAMIAANPSVIPVASITDKTWESSPVGLEYINTFLDGITVPLPAISLHPYTEGWVAASHVPPTPDRWKFYTLVEESYEKLVAGGYPNTKIYLSEMGWPGGFGEPTPVSGIQITEAEQADYFVELWEILETQPYVHGLIPFCVTNPGAPDQSGQTGYSTTSPENFYGWWHTTGGAFELGDEKPVVAAFTALSAVTQTATSARRSTVAISLPGDPVPASNEASSANYMEDYVASHGGSGGGGGGSTSGMLFETLMRPMNVASAYPSSDIASGGSALVSGVNPGYTGQEQYDPSSGRFRISGVMVNNTPQTGYWSNSINSASDPQNLSSYSWESYIYGDRFAIPMNSGGTADFWVFVDGMPLSKNWFHTATNGACHLPIVFNSTRVRRVTAYWGPDVGWDGILIPAAGDIWPAEPRPIIFMTGDSYVQGQGNSGEGSIKGGTQAGETAVLTGCDVWNFSQGGTGYTAGVGFFGLSVYGSSDRVTAMADVAASENVTPDIVLIYGGGNDIGSLGDNIGTKVAAAQSCWNAYAAEFPNSKLVVAGIETGTTAKAAVRPAMVSYDAAMKLAAEANSNVDLYISQYDPGPQWVLGDGNVEAPTGGGNGDIFVSGDPDEIHPTHGGHRYLATRLVNEMRKLVMT